MAFGGGVEGSKARRRAAPGGGDSVARARRAGGSTCSRGLARPRTVHGARCTCPTACAPPRTIAIDSSRRQRPIAERAPHAIVGHGAQCIELLRWRTHARRAHARMPMPQLQWPAAGAPGGMPHVGGRRTVDARAARRIHRGRHVPHCAPGVERGWRRGSIDGRTRVATEPRDAAAPPRAAPSGTSPSTCAPLAHSPPGLVPHHPQTHVTTPRSRRSRTPPRRDP